MKEKREFTSRPSRKESIVALAYLPVHMVGMPFLLSFLLIKGLFDAATANLLGYVAGTVFLLAFMWRFLRCDFDALCDRKGYCMGQIIISYGLVMLSNIVVSGIMMLIGLDSNPNNGAIFSLVGSEFGKMAATTVFLAPILEELIFRAGLFNVLRRRSRALAYAVNMLFFSVYHVWSYAIDDPVLWIYAIQYVPLTFIICRCYERTNTIWGSIFLHMLINGVSMFMMFLLQNLMSAL